MKVLSTDGLNKLIQLVKDTFILKTDVVSTSEVTLAQVATSGSYNDLSNKPTIPTTTSSVTSGSSSALTSGGAYTALSEKQNNLVSGTNIKTINNESILGSGNITISGGGGLSYAMQIIDHTASE